MLISLRSWRQRAVGRARPGANVAAVAAISTTLLLIGTPHVANAAPSAPAGPSAQTVVAGPADGPRAGTGAKAKPGKGIERSGRSGAKGARTAVPTPGATAAADPRRAATASPRPSASGRGATPAAVGRPDPTAAASTEPSTATPAERPRILEAISITGQPENETIVIGATAQFGVAATGATGYQWQVAADGTNFANIPGQTGAILQIPNATKSMTGYKYRVDVIDLETDTLVTSKAAALTVVDPVAITGQPQPQTVEARQPAEFTVIATHAAKYQWMVSTDNGANYGPVSGATSATYKIDSTSVDMSGNRYKVVAYGAALTDEKESAPVTLTVDQVLHIDVQPAGQPALPAGSATFAVTASGPNAITYQWQRSTDGVSYQNVAGGSAATLELTGITAGMDESWYRVRVTDGAKDLTSDPAKLNVVKPVGVQTNPTDVNVLAGQPVVFSAVGIDAERYVWEAQINGGAWQVVELPSTGSLNLGPANPFMNGAKFRVIVLGEGDSKTFANRQTSTAATLTLHPAVSITTAPQPQTTVVGADATFTVAGGNVVGYQWQQFVDGGWAPVSGATTATLTVPGATAAQDGRQYRVVLTGAATGDTRTSEPVTLTVAAKVVITGTPAAQDVVAGGDATFTVTAPGATGYVWEEFVDSSWTAVPGATSATLTVNGVTTDLSGRQFRVVVTGTGPGNTVTSKPVTLTVRTPAAVTAQPQNQAAVAGKTATFSVTATDATGFQWQVSTDGGTTWTAVAGQNTATLTVPNVTTSARYRVVITGPGTGNTVTSAEVVLTVHPAVAITGQPADRTVVDGTTATFSVTATGLGKPAVSAVENIVGPYQWQLSTDGTTFTDLIGADGPTLTVPSTTLSMSGRKYRVVVTGRGLDNTVTSKPATLTVVKALVAPTGIAAVNTAPGVLTVSWAYAGDPTGVSFTAQAFRKGTDEPVGQPCTGTPATRQCALSGLPDGTYTVAVSARRVATDEGLTEKVPDVDVAPPAPPAVPDATTVDGTFSMDPVGTEEPTVGGQVTVTGTGFQPYSLVTVTIYSAPVSLGFTNADANGNFSFTVTLPRSLAAGNHNLLASGIDAGGQTRLLLNALQVRSATVGGTHSGGGGGLAITGTPTAGTILTGWTMLIVGLGLVAVGRRRRGAVSG